MEGDLLDNKRKTSRKKSKPLGELKMSEILPAIHEGEELDLIKQRMQELNIYGDVEKSTRKNKRWKITVPIDGKKKTIFFGDPLRENFLIHKDEERRQRFLNRFKNAKNRDNPASGIYYSIRLLW